jgi:hypothetical protein
VNWFLWWKCLDCLDWSGFFWCQSVDTVGRCTTSYLLAGPACLRCLVNHEVLHQLEIMYYLKAKVKGISWQPAHQPIANMAATVPPICKHVCTSALIWDKFNVQIYWSTYYNLFLHVTIMVQSSIFQIYGDTSLQPSTKCILVRNWMGLIVFSSNLVFHYNHTAAHNLQFHTNPKHSL